MGESWKQYGNYSHIDSKKRGRERYEEYEEVYVGQSNRLGKNGKGKVVSRDEIAPTIKPEVAMKRFYLTLIEKYAKYNLELPPTLYLADSRAEEDFEVPDVRAYPSSDIDILVAEPEVDESTSTGLETEIRDALGESGVDFNFAPLEDLKKGNAYGRVCKPIPENWSAFFNGK
jgi:hypothetical protein